MSMISKQIDDLRAYAKDRQCTFCKARKARAKRLVGVRE